MYLYEDLSGEAQVSLLTSPNVVIPRYLADIFMVSYKDWNKKSIETVKNSHK